MLRYRPNVAALMVKTTGSLLICERQGIKGAWQFPQGGVDGGETLEEALAREVHEEIGLLPQHYSIIGKKTGYRYLYPPDAREKKIRKHGGAGQEQAYFLCRLHPDAPEVDINQRPQEFQAYRWILPEEFDIEWVPEFKRDVYRAVMRDFFRINL